MYIYRSWLYFDGCVFVQIIEATLIDEQLQSPLELFDPGRCSMTFICPELG